MAPRRSDAERNRERILAAARAAFADPEADVSMNELAQRAGVGSATLYRNFANRRAVLEALYVDEIDGVCAAARTLTGETPGAVLETWLRRFYAYFTSKRLVASELLQVTDADAPVFGEGFTRVLAAGRPLLDAAQASGEVRADLGIEQVLELVAAVGRVGGDEAHREPMLHVVLGGLRPG